MPDLLLFDVRLPDTSGPQLALKIHERHPGIPVLFVSGWANELVNPDTLTPLRWEFLPKPFEPEILVDRIQRLLKQSQAALGDALQ
jgi:DNA-binding NtrC family response regulator